MARRRSSICKRPARRESAADQRARAGPAAVDQREDTAPSAPTPANSMRASPPTNWRSACRPGPRSWSISHGESDGDAKSLWARRPVTEPFGRQCLLARRMVERGVRFVKILHGAGGDRWDDHGNIRERLPVHCREVDQPGRRASQGPEGARAAGRDAGGLGLGDGPHAVRQQPGDRQARPRPQSVRPGRLAGRRRRQGRHDLRRNRRLIGSRGRTRKSPSATCTRRFCT